MVEQRWRSRPRGAAVIEPQTSRGGGAVMAGTQRPRAVAQRWTLSHGGGAAVVELLW